jgi:alpha-tubulin suppressor-like RCC1 family protein
MHRAFMGWVGAVFSVDACVQRSDVLGPAPSQDSSAASAAPFVEQVSANEMHTCALTAGVIYCWGDDTLGQLGVGSVAERLTPTPIEQTGWQSVRTGLTHTCALSQRGEVYCWGDNARGQLGQGNIAPSVRPVPVVLGARAAAIASGFNHSCALLENAELWCWGDNNEGQLGRGDGNPGEQSRAADGLLPAPVTAPTVSGEGIGQWALVDAGEGHTCAVQVDDSLWCWGRNSQGQLGTPTDEGQHRSPVLVSTEHAWTQLDAALSYTCALDRDRSLWCWGHNQGTNSEAGNPFGAAIVDAYVPTRVGAGPWQEISTHGFHTCGLDAAAELWCWGRTSDGQIPAPDERVHDEPLQVAENVAQVSAGTFSTCFTTLDGTLQCAGQNDRWQLGAGGREEGMFLPVVLPPRSADAGP